MQDETLRIKLKTTFQRLGVANDEEKQNEIIVGLNCLANIIIDSYLEGKNGNRKTTTS